jgi:hypothetical protein
MPAQKPTITVEIGDDGSVTVDVTGVTGPACKDLTRELEGALGKVTSTTNKAEFNQLGVTNTNKQQIGG